MKLKEENVGNHATLNVIIISDISKVGSEWRTRTSDLKIMNLVS